MTRVGNEPRDAKLVNTAHLSTGEPAPSPIPTMDESFPRGR
jgi:hypothetical protein